MKWKWIPVVLIVCLHASILWHSATKTSASVDELSHLATGLYSLNNLDFRINRVAPPFQNLVNAIPVALWGDYQLLYDNECWKKGIWNGIGDQLLLANPENFHSLLMRGRIGTIVLSVLLCLTAFIWAWECWGYMPALVVLFLIALEPNIMAHGRLTTTDTAPTFLFLLTGYFFWRFTRKPSFRRLVLIGIGFGLSWYSKHSGVILLPALFLGFLFVSWFFVHRQKENEPSEQSVWSTFPAFLSQRLRNCSPIIRHSSFAFLSILLVFGIGFLVIWGGYAFEVGDSIPGPRAPMRSYIWHHFQVPITTFFYFCGMEHGIDIDGRDPNEPFWLFLRNYLPAFSHWEGFFSNQAHLRTGHLGYFMGELSSYGWRSYYPVLFLIKTPLPLLLIFLFGALAICFRRIHLDGLTLASFLLIPGIYAYVIIFFNTANIGYRHALPIVPFLIVFFAGSLAAFWIQLLSKGEYKNNDTEEGDALYPSSYVESNGEHKATSRNLPLPKKIMFGMGMLVLVWNGIEVLRIHPHYLEYFNSLIGGPKYGHYYAVDSNLDWGQDLLHLKRYLNEHRLNNVRLLYFGPKEYPDAYHVPHGEVKNLDSIEPGIYVVSASYLHGIGSLPVYEKLGPFHRREPDEYITYAMFLYHMR